MPAETAQLTSREALDELGSLEHLHAALEKRATGITWFIWGLAVAGIFVTYNFFGVLTELEPDVPPIVFALAWVPWTILGILTTAVLWRSVGLVVPSNLSRRDLVLGLILFLALIPGGIFLMQALDVPWVEPAVSLGVVGAVYLLVGAFGWACSDQSERWAWYILGAAYVLATVVGSVAIGDNRDLGYAVFSFLAPGLVLVGQTLAGLYFALKA